MNSLLDSLPFASVLWLVVYAADYYLSLYARRLWLRNASYLMNFQGRYEINPFAQGDENAIKRLRRRFMFMVVFGILWMLFMWGATHYLNIAQVFQVAVGFLILMEVLVLSGHVQNIRFFKSAAIAGAMEGQVTYAYWVSIVASLWKFSYWGVVFLIFSVIMSSWFFAGGVLACLYEVVRLHQRNNQMRLQPKYASSASPSIEPKA